MWSWVLQGSKPRMTVVTEASSELLYQTRVVSSQLSRTGAIELERIRENPHCWKLLPRAVSTRRHNRLEISGMYYSYLQIICSYE
jgi:hypothetical protein